MPQGDDVRADKRPLGPEKFVVRVFRERCVEELIRANALRPALDEFLRVVLTSEDCDASDRKYARMIYQDAILRIGGTGLPEWVVKGTPPPAEVVPTKQTTQLSNDDFEAMIAEASTTVGLGQPDDEFAAYTGAGSTRSPSLTASLQAALADIMPLFVRDNTHPFIQVFHGPDNARYVAIGSVFGTIPSGPSAGKSLNVNFTINPHKRLRDVPPDILVRDGARMLSVTADDPHRRGIRKTLYILHHQPGLKIRFWTRLDEEDVADGRKFVVLTDDALGWKLVDRKQF